MKPNKALKKIAPVKDKVHNYMYFSPLHRLFIDTPHFQRLHNVLQNGAAYTAFPSNRTSRFSHSLGVGYLAGRIFISSISKASKETLSSFINTFCKITGNMEIDINKCYNLWKTGAFSPAPYSHKPLYGGAYLSEKEKAFGGKEYNFWIDILWFTIVLVSLYHDVGHLPFSHSFEEAIKKLKAIDINSDFFNIKHQKDEEVIYKFCNYKDKLFGQEGLDSPLKISKDFESYLNKIRYWLNLGDEESYKSLFETNESVTSRRAIHEIRGFKIFFDYSFSYVVDSIRKLYKEYSEYEEFLKLAKNLSIVIYLSETWKGEDATNEYVSLFSSLKYLYSGYMDADRLDYTLRDLLESGLDKDSFDLERIIENYILISCHNYGFRKFYFASLSKALPSIIEFYRKRYLVYDIVVYHKCVLKSNIILENILYRLLALSIFRSGSVLGDKANDDLIVKIINVLHDYHIIKRQIPDSHKDSKSIHEVEDILPNDERSILFLTDASIIGMFYKILFILQQKTQKIHTKNSYIDEATYNNLIFIRDLILYFLHRNYANIVTIGKNINQIYNYLEQYPLEECKNPFVLYPSSYDQEGIQEFYQKRKECKDILVQKLSGFNTSTTYLKYLEVEIKSKLPSLDKEGSHKIVLGLDINENLRVKELRELQPSLPFKKEREPLYRYVGYIIGSKHEESNKGNLIECINDYLTCLCRISSQSTPPSPT